MQRHTTEKGAFLLVTRSSLVSLMRSILVELSDSIILNYMAFSKPLHLSVPGYLHFYSMGK